MEKLILSKHVPEQGVREYVPVILFRQNVRYFRMKKDTSININSNPNTYLHTTDLADYQSDVLNEAEKALRILLIFPPAENAVRALYTFEENEDTSIGIKPPLGVMYLAAYLKQKSKHIVKVLDCQVEQLGEKEIEEEIRQFDPHIVGISAWTDFWYDAYRCIQIAKQVNPNIHVTVGGPHVGIFGKETLEHSGCDSVIVGDGEIPLLWLANSIANNVELDHLPGIHNKKSGYQKGPDEFFILSNLDSLPFPDRHSVPLNKYFSAVSKSRVVTTMITSRGCPFHCIYCKLNFQKNIARSAENVVAEFEQISASGIKEVEIYDDTFTWSKKRVINICNGIIEKGLDIHWAIRDRVSSADEEMMAWLAKAGCSRIHYGIESGLDRTLRRIKKNITSEQAKNAVGMAKKFGMEVLTYFMLGLPGETAEDMQASIQFAKSLNPDFSTFSVAVPYAGTEMYQEGLASGIIPEDYWMQYAIKPTPKFEVPHFWEEFLTKQELQRMRDKATRSFYFRPGYILRQTMKAKSPAEIFRKGRMAWGLLKATVAARRNENGSPSCHH